MQRTEVVVCRESTDTNNGRNCDCCCCCLFWCVVVVAVCFERSDDNAPDSSGDERMLESPHPYSDNMDVYTPVRIPGATKLLISFDERTDTEAGCDYVKVFKDDTHGAVWGADKYSGDGASGNWPGLGGRPPLEVPGDSFVFHFKSDGSRAEWGYRALVRASCRIVLAASSSEVGHGVKELLSNVDGAFWQSSEHNATHQVTATFGGSGVSKVELRVLVGEAGSWCPRRVDVTTSSGGPRKAVKKEFPASTGAPYYAWVTLYAGDAIRELTLSSNDDDRDGRNIRFYGIRAAHDPSGTTVRTRALHTGEYRAVTSRPPHRRAPGGNTVGKISVYCGKRSKPDEGKACEHGGGVCQENHWSCCGERDETVECSATTSARNSEGVRTFPCFDPAHAKAVVHYCGRTVGQSGYHSPCGSCDGQCGPANGCQCKSCYEFDHPGGTLYSAGTSAAA